MSCPEWQADLVERARGGPVPAGLEAHLTACPRCAARLAEERALSAVLAEAAAADDGVGPSRSVEIAVVGRLPQRRTARRAGRRLLLAAAAALLAATLPLMWPAPQPGGAFEEPEAAFRSVPGAEPLRPDEAGQLVRVGLSTTALQALGWPVELHTGGLLETELILGSDGTARAMRLATVPAEASDWRTRNRGGRR